MGTREESRRYLVLEIKRPYSRRLCILATQSVLERMQRGQLEIAKKASIDCAKVSTSIRGGMALKIWQISLRSIGSTIAYTIVNEVANR